jgi:hypothetical protein
VQSPVVKDLICNRYLISVTEGISIRHEYCFQSETGTAISISIDRVVVCDIEIGGRTVDLLYHLI